MAVSWPAGRLHAHASYVLPDKRLGGSGEERRVEVELSGIELAVMAEVVPRHFGGSMAQCSAIERCIENTGFGKSGIELANDPQRLERWCYRHWLYLQQAMKWPFIHSWQKQVQKCLVDL